MPELVTFTPVTSNMRGYAVVPQLNRTTDELSLLQEPDENSQIHFVYHRGPKGPVSESYIPSSKPVYRGQLYVKRIPRPRDH